MFSNSSGQVNADTIGEEKEENVSNPSTPSIHQLDLSETAHVTSSLNIKGNKVGQNFRPRTSPYKRTLTAVNDDLRDGSHSPDSIAATYTVRENRSERQTKIKLESLERRLRANEKARKEIEGEAEKWKETARKNGKRLPDLEIELAEMTQAKDEWMAKSQEVEIFNKQLTEERDELFKKLQESEEKTKMFGRRMINVFNPDNEIAPNIEEGVEETNNEIQLENVEKEIMKYRTKILSLEQENIELNDKLKQMSKQLTENQGHVSTLMDHLETNKTQSQQIQGICTKELKIRQEHESRINHDCTILNSVINEQKLELDMVRSEIRCLKSYAQEVSNSNRNNIILLKSAESDRKSLLETLSVLLSSDEEPTETNIKKSIRDLVREKSIEQTKRLEAEKKAISAESVLLDQAKQQRNALFRARMSEEEQSKCMEKIEELEQELLASDLERKNLEHQIMTLEKCISKVSQILNVDTGTVFDTIVDRIEELVNQESVYRMVISENRLISDNILRGLHSVRKEMHGTRTGKSGGAEDMKNAVSGTKGTAVSTAAKIIQERTHTLKTIDKMDKLNKDLLTTMTIETLRAADIEKTTMKKKMSEQEAKIRQLEREKKEGERIRTIIAKWETRNTPKPDKSSPVRKVPSMDQLRTKSQTSILSQV